MKYLEFKAIPDIDIKLLRMLGAIVEIRTIVKIDSNTSDDLSSFNDNRESTLVFDFSWSFAHELKSVLVAKLGEIRIFHNDCLNSLSAEFDMEYLLGEEEFLNKVYKKDENIMWNEGYDLEAGGLKLNGLKVSRIDNARKEIVITGSYDGDSYSIAPYDWGVFAECRLVGIRNNNSNDYFYLELLSESYSQKATGNYKISYFICFSALENYINTKMNSHNRKGRLKDLAKQLCKEAGVPIDSSQVYTSIMSDYSEFENTRHSIAHGRGAINILEADLDQLVIFVLVFISVVEGKGSTFDALAAIT